MGRARFAAGACFLLSCARTGLSLPDPDAQSGGGGEGGSIADLRDDCTADAECPHDDPCVVPYCAERPDPRTRRSCQSRPLACDDGDACTLDRCDPAQRGCVHERLADKDGDGFIGKAPDGVPGRCGGTDCDDDDASVYPGAPELCDGKDNDCNGGIDENATYAQVMSPALIAPSMDRTENRDFVFDGQGFGLTYTHAATGYHTEGYFERVDGNGTIIAGPTLVSDINADAFAGSIAWSGASYLTTFHDARQAGNYEIYATRFNEQAAKLQPDLRLTNADDFSLNPVVSYTGSEYVTVYEDHRLERAGGVSAIYGRRLSTQGEVVGDELRLTTDDEDAQFANLSAGMERLGVAYVVPGDLLADGVERSTRVRFRTFDLTLGDGTPPLDLGADGQDPSVTSVGDDFVVAWHTGSEKRNWGSSLQAATLDARGNLIAASTITYGDAHAKTRSLVSLGDRVLVLWSATPVEGDVFQLFYETVRVSDLAVVMPRQLLLKSATGGNLVEPHGVLGAIGQIAITYNDSGSFLGYFTRLICQMGAGL